MNINDIKIIDVCNKLQTDKNLCPKCGKGKLWIKDDYFRCFKPGCKTSGDAITYVAISKGLSFKYAVEFLKENFGPIDLLNLPLGDNHFKTVEQRERRQLLSQIFNLCKQYKTDYKAIEYLYYRGLDPNKIEYGFWPINSNGNKDLIRLNTGIKLSKFEELKLVNSKNQEVFADRIIFPIKNLNGDILYFQGRSLDPETKLRWLTSANDNKTEQSVFSYFYNTDILSKDIKTLFICEGITDALSLQELDLNVVASLNLYPPLLKYKHSLDKLDYIIAFYDNDKYNVNFSSITEYKSWDSVLDILVDLKLMKPELLIYCIMPPEKTGITDINEWLISIEFDKDIALDYIRKNVMTLEEFLIKKFLHIRREDIFKILNILPNEDQESYKQMLVNAVEKQYKSWVDFLIEKNVLH
jgi:hypothetical protein